jgi:hypothetical protein
VDLNPVRAGIAETPETSDYTSIQERIAEVPEKAGPDAPPKKSKAAPQPVTQAPDGKTLRAEKEVTPLPRAKLMSFDAASQIPWAIPFGLEDYLELVDWTGRAILSDKRGFIPLVQPGILDRLGIDPEQFIRYAERMLKEFGTAVGAPASMVNLCARRQTKYLHGIRAARRMFEPKQAA